MASEIQHPVKALNCSINPSVEDPMKNPNIDLPAKAGDNKMSGLKDRSTSDATSCISAGDAISSIKESEVDQESLMADQGMYYPVNGSYGYYYPGVDGSFGEWDAQSYFVGTDGLEIQRHASQADNGSVMYYFPGFQPDYTSYNPFLPGAMINVDGQYSGQQLYYPSSMISQPFISPGLFPQSVAYGPELVPAYSWDSSPLYADGLYGNLYGDTTYSTPKPNFSSQSHTHVPSKTSLPSKSTITTEKRGSSLALDASPSPATPNQSLKPINKASVLSKGFLPINKLPSYPNQGKAGLLYPHSTTNIKETGRSWIGTEKLKARNKAQGSGDFDVLNEQNRGPRTNGAKSTWNSEADPVGSLGGEGNDNSGTSIPVVRKDEYNLPDFPKKYNHALFFVIKSYSEDDIHKSIKYNVWASTPNGNKRLDNAFQVAQEEMAEKGSKCPVFLFFSVNASGQFCGVAEMISRVDFSKNMDFWQQDKWTGYFPVKWHIIKDVPNPQLRHIILENNENKPVTNSRDTQEVKFIQGTEMLNIFKNYSSKTSILDDFSFYENRQKEMQDKRIKHPTPNLEHLLPKTDGKAQATKPGDLNYIVSGLQSIELTEAGTKEQLLVGGEVKE